MLKATRLDLNPKRIYFRDQKGLEEHQRRLLRILESAHNSNDSIKMWTSGTSSSLRKMYLYTRQHHAEIEDYHISRIMWFNGWKPGTALVLKAVDANFAHKPLSRPYASLPTGRLNKTVDLYYRTDYGVEEWNKTLAAAAKTKPSFLYCRPSEILLMRGAEKVGFPVLTSMETLHDYTRTRALELFSDCVDKMRCWDGGLSFFECRHKTKHINDELCIAEEDDGRILSTDPFNHSQKFFRYHNGDMGEIETNPCECGIYGKTFRLFAGRSMEIIVTKDGSVPGFQVADAIFHASDKARSLPQKPFNFCIFQRADRNIDFKTDDPLKPDHMRLIKEIFVNIDRTICVDFSTLEETKSLKKRFIVSEAAKEFHGRSR